MTAPGISMDVVGTVLEALHKVLPASQKFTPLHEPSFRGNEVAYLRECIETGWVSSVGAFVDKFEAQLCTLTGAKYAIAAVNGTAALQLALEVAGVEEGDEVIVPTLSFVATANAVAHCGAIPHFADSETVTLGICPEALREHLESSGERTSDGLRNRETGRRIRALVPMHVFGHPSAMTQLLEVAEEFSLIVVEDAAESLGSYYHGRHTGTLGRLGTLSFNGNKTITTGGGGAILTNDEALARKARHLSTTAKMPHRWEFMHDEVGYNFRMPNLNAAVGCAQLEQLPDLLAAKRRLFARYEAAFSDVEIGRIMAEPDHCHSNYWLQTLILNEDMASHRDGLLSATNEAGIQTRPCWKLLHDLPMYQQAPRMETPRARQLERRIINLPSSSNLG